MELREKLSTPSLMPVIQPPSFQLAGIFAMRWVEAFMRNIAHALGNPQFAPLKRTGLTGVIATWNTKVFHSLTDSHAAYRIRFPDGATFYFIDSCAVNESF
jgi:hypothetical protein